jgi:hypothetical protein
MPIKTLRDTVHIFSWGSCILNFLVYSHVYHLKCLLVQVWYWTEFSNMTGEEIISGAQRVHTPELLRKRAIECGIDASTISSYIESFRFVLHPHCVTAISVLQYLLSNLYCNNFGTQISSMLTITVMVPLPTAVSVSGWREWWCFSAPSTTSGKLRFSLATHRGSHHKFLLWDRQLVPNACTMLTNLLVKYRNNLGWWLPFIAST